MKIFSKTERTASLTARIIMIHPVQKKIQNGLVPMIFPMLY